jgi:hypothetical protein
MFHALRSLAGFILLALAGCAVVPPPGPSIAAMPGKDKSLEQFQQDDAACRQYAAQGVGFATPAQAASASATSSAAVGTLLGAAAGALIGAAAGNPGVGAAIGGGSGLLVGSAEGAHAGTISGGALQQRYDAGYLQCMASKSNSVPTVSYAYYPAYPYAYPAYPYYPYWWGPSFVGGSFVFFGGHHHHHHHGGGGHRH